MLLAVLTAVAGCGLVDPAQAHLPGVWVDRERGDRLDISHDGSSWTVAVSSGARTIGTFGAEYDDGRLRLSPATFGDVTYVASTDEVLFAGERFAKLPAGP